jgi:hypothetical protein
MTAEESHSIAPLVSRKEELSKIVGPQLNCFVMVIWFWKNFNITFSQKIT